MKTIFLLSFFLLAGISYSQSKKEQIELLINRVDSLNQVLSSERSASSQKVSEFNAITSSLESKISTLNATISNLNLELQTSKTDASSKQTELNSKQQEITILEAQVKQKTDSLALVLTELEKLKPAPKPVVTNSTNQVTQTGSYKSVKIGTQTWMTENLNVSTFRNGDPIPEVKTNEEWKKAGENKQPAWCYYDNDPKNGAKYGKLYNWYAVNDPRGLAPAGWHIPTDEEWTTLGDHLGDDDGKKMKSTSGWDNWPEDLTCKNCESWNAEYRKKTACHVCKDTRVTRIWHKSIGNNSSGFSGLPGGKRTFGYFSDFLSFGWWWSSSEHSTDDVYYRYLSNDGSSLFGASLTLDGLSRYAKDKAEGLSVRCLRD
jgi:uncharacterized protein (TIGR02145 family)